MIYLITYDLNDGAYNKGERDRKYLYDSIKSLGTWYHVLKSVWFIKSEHNADYINKFLFDAMGMDGQILVTNITKSARRGILPISAWEWLRSQETGLFEKEAV